MKNRTALGSASRLGIGLLALASGCSGSSVAYRAQVTSTMGPAAPVNVGYRRGGMTVAADSAGAPGGGAEARWSMPTGGAAPTVAAAPAPMAPPAVQAMPRQPPPPAGAPVPEAPTRERDSRADDEASQAQMSAGILTAASVGDADRLENYRDYLARHVPEREELGLDMSRRLRVRVVDGAGHAVNDAAVRVRFGARTVDGRTHADGTWDFFPGAFGMANVAGGANVEVAAGSARANANAEFAPTGDAQDLEFRLQGAQSIAPQALDLAFAIDVTGSMGDELRYVNHELTSIVERVRAANPGLRVRVGATFYRDRTDAELVRDLPFTTNVADFVGAMREVYANGGGDYPEDMNTGLDHAMHSLQWSQGNVARVLVVIADAPPQHYANTQFTYRDAVREASSRGIRLLPVAASGANRTVEYLFRAIGAATSTPYTYLTDDSGVGGSHMEADTDRVAVERFNDLLTRLVISDLRGQGMHEPGPLGRS